MQSVELAEETDLFPFQLAEEDLKDPGPPVRFGILFTKYSLLSPLQTTVSLFYAKVKINGKWEYKGAKNTWFKKDLKLLQVYELITSDAFKSETDTLQAYTDEKEAKAFKATHFNYATFSGTFHKRKDEKLIKHSCLICIDLDNLGAELFWIRETVNKDPLTIMSFISPSGDGLKVIFCIEPKRYSQEFYYRAISKYLSNKCSLSQEIDPSCKDVSRACFLPCDPNAYLNLNFCRI